MLPIFLKDAKESELVLYLSNVHFKQSSDVLESLAGFLYDLQNDPLVNRKVAELANLQFEQESLSKYEILERLTELSPQFDKTNPSSEEVAHYSFMAMTFAAKFRDITFYVKKDRCYVVPGFGHMWPNEYYKEMQNARRFISKNKINFKTVDLSFLEQSSEPAAPKGHEGESQIMLVYAKFAEPKTWISVPGEYAPRHCTEEDKELCNRTVDSSGSILQMFESELGIMYGRHIKFKETRNSLESRLSRTAEEFRSAGIPTQLIYSEVSSF
jgi:hypothetical protein